MFVFNKKTEFRMHSKKFKYQAYLDRFPNCPSDSYQALDKNAFRWAFDKNLSNSFKPMSLMKEPPQRMLDDSDLMCKGFGLSLFDTFENGYKRYFALYKKKRSLSHQEFIDDKGNVIAELKMIGDEGVYGDLNSANGHFTFHEFEATDLATKIIRITEIFDKNGNFTR